MAFMKTNCPCDRLYFSETLGGYDFFCDKDGRTCNAASYDREKNMFYISDQEDCDKHKDTIPEEEKEQHSTE